MFFGGLFNNLLLRSHFMSKKFVFFYVAPTSEPSHQIMFSINPGSDIQENLED